MLNKYLFCLVQLFILPIAGYGQHVTHPAYPASDKPNVIIIYADDLGYGDISCYGTASIKTPHIDRLAAGGLVFSNAHSSAATCTPSRYSIMTGQYAWRKKGTGVAPGNAALLIDTGITTLPKVFQRAGYQTAAIGKWHLGLGPAGGPDWNGNISPGANEVGFNYSFLIPATPDRVPCVYVENHHVVNLDPNDPISVSYQHPVGNLPTGKDHPELLVMKSSPGQGHDQTIINGIGRIGYMSGGRSAWWTDSTISKVLLGKAVNFIKENKQHPFFLYFASHDIHVPRVPGYKYMGKSGMGPRGDEILELDGETGRIMQLLDSLHLDANTIIVFSSDNGPVLDDGYQDGAVAGALHPALNTPVAFNNTSRSSHKPAGPYSGGKYSVLEGGTRMPFIVYWPVKIKPGKSDALICQADLLASFAKFTRQKLNEQDATDSRDVLKALLGKSKRGRKQLVEEGTTLALVEGDWKYIEPHAGPAVIGLVNIASGLNLQPQLYNLKTDTAEKYNVAGAHPAIVRRMAAALKSIKDGRQTRSQ